MNDSMQTHTSQQYDAELEAIRNNVIAMGSLVEEQLKDAMKGLLKHDYKLAKKVADSDHKVNALEVEIDEECKNTIALRQPAAGDLRFIITMIKVITDLERIGDEAEKIGRLTLELMEDKKPKHDDYYASLKHLGKSVRDMLNRSLNCFARMDVDEAMKIVEEDEEINNDYDALIRQLITFMMEDPRTIRSILSVMWSARALERIGDHSKNICEYVIFMVKGKDIRHTEVSDMQAVVKS